jgi:hypothetical protein
MRPSYGFVQPPCQQFWSKSIKRWLKLDDWKERIFFWKANCCTAFQISVFVERECSLPYSQGPYLSIHDQFYCVSFLQERPRCNYECRDGPPFSHLNSYINSKSNLHFPKALATICNKPVLKRLLTFHVTNLISIFRCLLCAKESVHFQDCVEYFFTSCFWQLGVISVAPNPKAGGPPPVGCPWLLIQYISRYPPCLEAVSSIRQLRRRGASLRSFSNLLWL